MPQPIGNVAPGAQVAELRPDSKRVQRVYVNFGTQGASVGAYLDGLGSGYGNTPLRAELYDAAGNFLAQSNEAVVADGQAAGWVLFQFGAKPSLAPGYYYLSVHAGVPVGAQQQTVRETPNIVARWKLDEATGNAVDDVGGSIASKNGPSIVQATPPLVGAGSSITFSVPDSYLQSSLALPGGSPLTAITAMAWIRVDDLANTRGIFRLFYSSLVSGGALEVTSDGRLQAKYGNGTSDVVARSAAGTILVGQTYHVATTHDGTTARVYINGVQAGSVSTPYNAGSSTIRIGHSTNNPPVGYFQGVIDEPAIFGRALTAAEISDIYSGAYRRGQSARVWGDDFATPPTNLIENPRAAVNLAGISSEGGQAPTVARSNAWSLKGGWSVRATRTVTAASTSSVTYKRADSSHYPVEPGKTYSAAAIVNVVTPPATGGALLYFHWRLADGTEQLSGPGPAEAPGAGLKAPKHTLTAPANAVGVRIRVNLTVAQADADAATTVDWYIGMVALAEGTSAPLMDGDDPGCTWDGTAHASKSRGPQGRVNLAANPRGALGNVFGSFTTGTPVVSEAITLGQGGHPAASQMPAEITTAIHNVSDANAEGRTLRFDAVNGETVTFSAWVYIKSAPGGNAIRAELRRPSGSTLDVTSTTAQAGWIRLAKTVVLDESGQWSLRLLNGFSATGNDVDWYYTGVLIEKTATLGDYFDASSVGSDPLGTAHNSPSIRWQVPELYDPYP